MRRLMTRAGLALVGGGLALGLAAAPAAAANDLESGSPSPGAKLKSAPSEVRLTFDDLILPGASSVSVTGPNGDATRGSSFVIGHEISRNLDGSLPQGRYTVSWRVGGLTDSDSGSYTFTIGSAVGATAAPKPTSSAPAPSPTRSERAAASPATPKPSRTRLASAMSDTRKRSEPVSSAAPTVAVPKPSVDAISSRRDEWLPPPVFWWAVIVLTATAIGTFPKAHRWWLANHPPRRRPPAAGPDTPDGPTPTLLTPDDADRDEALHH